MMRIWGLLKPQCLPVFSRSAESLDILPTLFRLLTRLALNPNEPDDVLLGEYRTLQFQMIAESPVDRLRRLCVSSVSWRSYGARIRVS